MKAAIYQGNKKFTSGESKKIEPGPNEVRLDVAFCGVCGTDIHIYHGHMDHRVKSPQVIGHEFSAKIAEVGSDVVGYSVGEAVTVRPTKIGELYSSDKGYGHISQNLQILGVDTPGGMQESLTVPANLLHKLPGDLPMSHAAMVEPLAVACHDIRLSELQPDEFCFVIGGGPIGLLIALASRIKGAQVMIAEVNPNRLAFAQSLGFQTCNPIEQDAKEVVKEFSAGHMMDVVFEVSASAGGAEIMTQVTNKRARIVMVGIHPEPRKVDLFEIFFSELKLIGARVYEAEDFEEAIALAASGQIPFEQLITDIKDLDQVQKIFETIDASPDGIKYLINCQGAIG